MNRPIAHIAALQTPEAPASAPATTGEAAPAEWPAEPTPKHGIVSIAWLAALFALVLAVAAWRRRRRT